MRENLRKARKAANNGEGFTQKEVAHKLGLTEVSYQRIEYGKQNTTTDNWDKLEDLFGIPQRQLRKNTKIEKEKKT